MRRTRRLRSTVATLAVSLVVYALLLPATAASAVSGAAFTTTDTNVDGTGHCKNGNEDVNCNIYDGKEFVWLNGGPATAYVGDGSYFFAVLAPGGQSDPNDGSAKNLSDDFDAYTNRTFSVSGGTISYSGGHDFDSNKIRLADYADTPNPGGVYIMAVCSLDSGYPVDPSSCKYDAFKIQAGEETPLASDPAIVKDAAGVFDRTFKWDIKKEVDKTLVKQIGGSATFTYTVSVKHDAGTDGNWRVTGTITVTNFNTFDVSGANITDAINDANTSCSVTGGSNATIPALTAVDFGYTCTYSAAPASSSETNKATVTWPDTGDLQNGGLAAGSASFSFDFTFPSDPANLIDECTTVSDPVYSGGSPSGTLGTVCVGDVAAGTWLALPTYTKTIDVPRFDCTTFTNTATSTTNDTSTEATASQTVKVCGPAKTGALTMGFWQNKNGQGIIKAGASTGGVCNSGTWLRQYAPFQDLSATATCTQVATYVYNLIKAANAGGSSMNPMLKAQMLATALDVYFSDPALGGNRIGAPSPIGGVAIDLTMICKMIDGSGGTATCSGSFQSVSAAFGGASSLTVSQMLAFAASQSNAGGSLWYGNVKATQELAKNAFDAINNQVAFAA